MPDSGHRSSLRGALVVLSGRPQPTHYQLVRVAPLSEPSVGADRAVGAVLRDGIADGSLSGVTDEQQLTIGVAA